MTKEKPIPFSAPMVRAVLAGTKTQTRRILKPQPIAMVGGGTIPCSSFKPAAGLGQRYKPIACPYGKVGDQLWVREAWRAPTSCDHLPPRSISDSEAVRFLADEVVGPDAGFGKGRPGMFMPRWASRLQLEVTAVRAERLQDISEEDAKAEGIFPHVRGGWHWVMHDSSNPDDWNQFGYKTAALAFQGLWELINGPESWAANPVVWAVGFRRLP